MKIRIAHYLNSFANKLYYLSDLVRSFSFSKMQPINQSSFVRERYILNKSIAKLKDSSNVYFQGYPYQSLGILNIFGDRETEDRFNEYRLIKYVKPDDNILDLGCNTGFLLLYTCMLTRSNGLGVDHNKKAIEIGQKATKLLKLENQIEFKCEDISSFSIKQKYNCVFSMATYWTDDKGYRVDLFSHLERISHLLDNKGLVFFETHAADYNSNEIIAVLKKLESTFEIIFSCDSDFNTRNFFILQRLF